jgi:hypothetical protein
MMAPRIPCDDGGSSPPYGSKRTSARAQPLRQLSLRQAPSLLRRPRHHTSSVPKSLRLPHRHVHLDPLLTPIKGRTRALLRKVGRAGTRTRQALAWSRSLPSPAWTLVTPYCKRTRPGHGTNTKAAGFPPLSRRSPAASLSPFALALALDPSGLGHAATLTRRPKGPPGLRTPTDDIRAYPVPSPADGGGGGATKAKQEAAPRWLSSESAAPAPHGERVGHRPRV